MNVNYKVIKTNGKERKEIGIMTLEQVIETTRGYKREANERGVMRFTRKNSQWVYYAQESVNADVQKVRKEYVLLHRNIDDTEKPMLESINLLNYNNKIECLYTLCDMITKSVVKAMYKCFGTNNMLRVKNSVFLWCAMGRKAPVENNTLPEGADVWQKCFQYMGEMLKFDSITLADIQQVRRALRSYVDRPIQANFREISIDRGIVPTDSEGDEQWTFDVLSYKYNITSDISGCVTELHRSRNLANNESVKRSRQVVRQMKAVLSDNEFQCFYLRCVGLTNNEIALRMGYDLRTIERYRKNIKEAFYTIKAVENYTSVIPQRDSENVEKSTSISIVAVNSTGDFATYDSIKSFSEQSGISRKQVYVMLKTGKEYKGYTVFRQNQDNK